jgi:dihydrofolate synthase/folylpolyglutamate synthase
VIPDRLRTLTDLEALLRVSTNYEEKLPREALSRAFDLSRTRRLLASVNDPQDGPVTVHVTGSKGKGSTCRMVDAVLRAAGRGPVGLYVSPHLEHLTERVSVDGTPVDGDELARAAETLLPHLRETFGGPDFPTFFEILTAAAHVAFRARGVATLVLEVGLGGRLDATTVCRPSVTAITTVELEHTALLGPTVERIAAEKAGILKRGVPCVTAVPEASAARAVIEAAAQATESPLLRIGSEFDLEAARTGKGPRLDVRVRGPHGATPLDAVLPVAGLHQAHNAAVAVAIARLLGVDDAATVEGLSGVTLPGRMERVLERPDVVIDGAHTVASARAAARAAVTCFPHRRLHLVLGLLEEKDVAGILTPLLEIATTVVACGVPSPRGLAPEHLAEAVLSASRLPVTVARDPAAGLDEALARAQPDDLVLVTGSLYLAGAARAAARRLPGFLPKD